MLYQISLIYAGFKYGYLMHHLSWSVLMFQFPIQEAHYVTASLVTWLSIHPIYC